MPGTKKVLLIGGSGFIGLHLAKSLSARHQVAIFCKNPEKLKSIGFLSKVKILKGDISDCNSAEEAVRGKDEIINLASVVNAHGDFDAFEDLEVNCRGQLNVLEAIKKSNRKARYIFIGTRAQFGRAKEKDLPVKEDYPQNPISLYGIHKSAAENYCRLYKRAFGINSIILRLPQVYGPSLSLCETHSIVDKFVKKALNGEKFDVNGYGKDIKDLVYIGDFAELINKILDSKVDNGIFNVGSGRKVTLAEIAKIVVSQCRPGSFRLAPFPKDKIPFELGSFYFDISKVSKEFKWKPKTSIAEGIKKTVEFYIRQV